MLVLLDSELFFFFSRLQKEECSDTISSRYTFLRQQIVFIIILRYFFFETFFDLLGDFPIGRAAQKFGRKNKQKKTIKKTMC